MSDFLKHLLTFLSDHIKQLPDKEREQELGKLRHCAVM